MHKKCMYKHAKSSLIQQKIFCSEKRFRNSYFLQIWVNNGDGLTVLARPVELFISCRNAIMVCVRGPASGRTISIGDFRDKDKTL